MSPFEVASRVTPLREHRYAARVPDGWQQGRGAFGGLVLGTLLRALEASEPEAARKTRTLMGELIGPVQPGDAEIAVSVLRRGSNQTNLRADLVQGGEVIAYASAVCSKARRFEGISRQSPARPRWQDVPPVPDTGLAPAFARHFDFRNVGPVPFAGGADAGVAGFVRERVAPTAVDAPALVALLDVWWPSFFSVADRPRLGATVSFTAEILCDPSTIDAARPLFLTARAVGAYEGFVVECRELWDEDRLVALNQQTFAVLG
jgi:hypothetical protein